ncbi:type II secretion system protein [bacterium]|nr:type II secretion system protein [bacterium]
MSNVLNKVLHHTIQNSNSLLTKYRAFTLAEVLITIGIIGVVAALTIPNLINNYKKQSTAIQLKSEYSKILQAIKLSITDNGDPSSWDKDNKTFLAKYIVPYLSGASPYNNHYNIIILSSKVRNNNEKNLWYYWPWSKNDSHLYILKSGTIINYTNGYLTIDINGPSKPNKLGIDSFVFVIDDKSVLSPLTCSATGTMSCVRDNTWEYYRGGCCASLIKNNNWKIPKDYPWGNGQ